MKKKLMFFLILICALLTVSAVNAKDIVKNDVTSEVVQNSHGDTPQNELSTTKAVTKNSKDNSINEKPIENTNLKKTSTSKTNSSKTDTTQTLKSTNSKNILSDTEPTHVSNWTSFCTAIDGGSTSIIFDNDIDVSAVTTWKNIEKDHSVVIDGAGKTISGLKGEDNYVDCLLSIRSDVTLKNIIFKNNLIDSTGTALIETSSTSPLKVINCTFQDNNNAIMTFSNSPLFINNSHFINNTCESDGIAIYAKSSNLEIYNSEFTENRADNGVIYLACEDNKGISTAIFNNCTFTKNSVDGSGGAICAQAKSSEDYFAITLNNCSFTENTASYGGAIAFSSNNAAILNNCSFTENTATEKDPDEKAYGNSLYFARTSLQVINTNLKNSDIYSTQGLVYPEFEVSIPDFEFGKEVTISVSAIDSFTGTVNVNINGTNYTVDLTSGSGSATVTPNLDVGGPYKASLIFEEPGYISTIVDSNEFNVESRKLNSTIEYEILNDVSGKVAIEIKVYDEDGNEITNSTLILNGGVTGNISTNKVYKNIGLAPGEYKIAVTYEPTAGYEGSTTNITLVVVQDPNITIDELQNNLTEANKVIVELKGNLAEANKVIVELKGNLAEANKVITELNATIADLKVNLAEANKVITELNATIADLKVNLAEANKQITNLNKTNAKLKNNLKTIKQKAKTLNNMVNAKIKKVTAKSKVQKSKNFAITVALNKKVKVKYVYLVFNGKIYKKQTNKKGIAKFTISAKVMKKLAGKTIKYQTIYGQSLKNKSVKINR